MRERPARLGALPRIFGLRLIAVGLAVLLMGAGETRRPPIVQAAKSGDKAALRALLQKGADVNAADADGSTALLWASYSDETESAGVLIRAGAKVNAATDLGVTPLWAASQNGSAPMVRMLLASGANPNAALLHGETPLMVAARSGYTEVVNLLLARRADVNARGPRKQTALMWAVAQKYPEVVKLLVAHGADVHARTAAWNEVMAVPPHGYLPYNRAIPHGSDTALMFAARMGDLESAKLLVDSGANVNDRDAWGISATVLAAHSGFRDFVEYLLAKGADPNASDAGFTVLHEAIMRRDEAMARALLEHGADANAPLRTWTPTRRSSIDFHFEPVLVGATPFWLAAHFNEPGIMRLLVKHGADPRFVHHSDYVATKGFEHHTDTTNALMAAVGMVGGEAWVKPPRPQREALALETVKLALELGIPVNGVNAQGRTALDGAKALGYDSEVQYLAAQGARPGKQLQSNR